MAKRGDEMTEDEAKTKWCPHVRLGIDLYTNHDHEDDHQSAYACNRFNGYERAHYVKCIASDCMMFKWDSDCEIPISNGMIAICDIGDQGLILQSRWGWHGRYVRNTEKQYLHTVLINHYFGAIPAGFVVDHIDGDTLNNRLGNLRICTQAQNIANSESRGGKSNYRGVYQARTGKWVAQISKEGERLTLGTFENEIDAAKAWDEKAEEWHGEYAKLNFSSVKNSGRTGHCGLAK